MDLKIKQDVPLAPKTTMRIGGTAKYYAELATQSDCEEALAFAAQQNIPLIPLGGGSNTIFADGTINALVVRISAQQVEIDGQTVIVQSGKNLPVLINELAQENLDLSPLTGILGTVGGAVYGNAGQGPQGIWIDSFVEHVHVCNQDGWRTISKAECGFGYRESVFKQVDESVIIWAVQLKVPAKPAEDIQAEIDRLLQQRLETQPHVKTAGSCFKAVGSTPAWQLIDAAGLRGHREGGVSVSEKHANFLINEGHATFEDASAVVETVRQQVADELSVEMRFIEQDGTVRY